MSVCTAGSNPKKFHEDRTPKNSTKIVKSTAICLTSSRFHVSCCLAEFTLIMLRANLARLSPTFYKSFRENSALPSNAAWQRSLDKIACIFLLFCPTHALCHCWSQPCPRWVFSPATTSTPQNLSNLMCKIGCLGYENALPKSPTVRLLGRIIANTHNPLRV